MSRSAADNGRGFRIRAWFVFAVLMLGASGLVAKAVRLQLVDRDFLNSKSDARIMRKVYTGANRGSIVDRNGTLLAISTPVESVFTDPQELNEFPDRWAELASALGRKRDDFQQRIASNQKAHFLWLARQISPAEGAAIRKLNIPAVHLTRVQKRFYPAGEVVSHVVGFTNVDEDGQEGAELMFDSWLAGEQGIKTVYQDRAGRHVEDIDNIVTARPGRELTLSLDMRLQNLANRELKAAIKANNAHAGWIVMIDVLTGEILALANQPTFNPNDRAMLVPKMYRNRAVTDIFEPGSSIKPFVMAAALESGLFNEASRIDVSQGFVKVGSRVVQDEHRQGILDLTGVLTVSSNAAMARISQQLKPELIWSVLSRFGFGHVTASEFRGESAGILSNYSTWKVEQIASLSYGYGLSITPLQLAQGYAALGALGVMRPLTIQRRVEAVPGERVVSEEVARKLIHMMESVVQDGTGTKAAIPGYRVAGKTGTAKKSNGAGGYYDDRYFAIFGGVAPATNPRLATVVVIDEPSTGRYYGGEVSAPVFAKVMGGALRLLGVAPDAATSPGDLSADAPIVVRR
ncbi:MAG: penicillin-binding transpeptidase domain-containing protein [Pseudomonadota bacterium]